MEDYLKAIHRVGHEQERVSTSAVAEAMGVTAASATNMLKRLAELKLVDHEPYRGVVLTPAGRRAALEVIRHHRLIELYLQQALGYQLDEVDAEAERLEHAMTQEFAARIEQLLGHPTHDPHGHPIPDRDLRLAEMPQTVRLSDVEAPRDVVVRVVDDRSAEMLRHLAAIGIRPGSHLEVVALDEATLVMRLEGRQHTMDRAMAQHVIVDRH